jgi:hypothetical protein
MTLRADGRRHVQCRGHKRHLLTVVRVARHPGLGLGPAKHRSGENPSIIQKLGLRKGNHATQTAFNAEVNIMSEGPNRHAASILQTAGSS